MPRSPFFEPQWPRRRLLSLALAGAAAASLGALAGCGSSDDDEDDEQDRADDARPAPNAQMQAVLDALAALGAQPVHTLTVAQARTQPTPADAVRAVLTAQGRSTDAEPVGSVEDRVIDLGAGAGATPVRIYTPNGSGPFPVILYIHGGGWVIATLDTYDASARALTNAAGAIVVSTEYRKAPENPFPAAHDDTFAAWQWVLANALSLGGSASDIAVVGESAGGNMAASISARARGQNVQAPVHQVLVYPVVDADVTSPSERQNANAMPLGTAELTWFFDKYLPQPSDREDPRFALRRATLSGLPSTTVITADIDPLRSEGRLYADALDDAGVDVRWVNYEGVTHEFFGMGAVLDEARAAVTLAGEQLKAAFARTT